MKTNISYILSSDELKDHLAYDFICTCIACEDWKCRKIRTKFEECFTEEERNIINNVIYKKAYKWYLRSGLPEEVEISREEYELWQRLKQFCYAYCKL